MRTLLYILFGVVYGFVLGAIAPILTYLILERMDPEGMRKGMGTPFAIMTPFTACAGAIWGAFRGYRKSNPAGELVKTGPRQTIDRFDAEFADRSTEEQRQALAAILPIWIDDFKRAVRIRSAVALILACMATKGTFLFGSILLMQLISIVRFVGQMADELRKIRTRWGDEVVAEQGRLPLSIQLYERVRTWWRSKQLPARDEQ